VRRRDFAAGLLLAGVAGSVRAEEQAKQHRIAIVIPAGPVARIDDPGINFYRAFWEELRRLGDVEGQNLIVERYSGDSPNCNADIEDVSRLAMGLLVRLASGLIEGR
jgi:putative tryptophan/tyrosine transport system substrate-binding protein